jgi:hypothetical protein
MVSRSVSRLAAILGFVLTASVVSAGGGAATVRVGTTGFGLEGSTALNEKVGLRAGGSLFSLGVTREESDVTFDADLKLRSLAAYVDLHPTGGAFRFTGGLVYNKNRVEATGVPTAGTFELNGVTYQASDVGTLSGVGHVGTRTWAPYLGIGFGSARGVTRLFFALDLGVVFQGPPRVDLTVTGPLASDALFQADLQAEEDDVNHDLDRSLYKYYPVFSIGLGIRF